jgi:hypothetical protein
LYGENEDDVITKPAKKNQAKLFKAGIKFFYIKLHNNKAKPP